MIQSITRRDEDVHRGKQHNHVTQAFIIIAAVVD